MMKTTILLSTLAFAAMTSPAWAQSSGQTSPARTLSTVDAQELKASATGRSMWAARASSYPPRPP